MRLQLQQPCPQCGAPVTLWETDRLLTCSYCGVKSYLLTDGPSRYTLPLGSRRTGGTRLVHVPYLRFRGAVYDVDSKGVHFRLIDTTKLLYRHELLAPSLGLRPQAMPLHRLTPQDGGYYIDPTLRLQAVLDSLIRQSGLADSAPGGFPVLVGETLSLVYLPLHLDGQRRLADGVTGTELGVLPPADSLPARGGPFRQHWQVRFLPALCPRCGWNLEGQGDSVVSICPNCLSAYHLNRTGFQAVSWQVATGRGDLYLPFWRLRCSFPSLSMASFADFLRLTNQPLLIRKEWGGMELHLWVPAFRLRPRIFLRLGQQVSVGQWRLNLADRAYLDNMHPVTLPAGEARQAVRPILAAAAVHRKQVLPLAESQPVFTGRPELVFLPCTDRNHDWQQEQTGAVVAKTILRFGRRL